MENRKMIIIFCMLVLIAFPFSHASAQEGLSEEAKACLGCHSSKDLEKRLENNDNLSLYVNADEFAQSVHNALNCNGCHTDISMQTHPGKEKIASKKAYAQQASQKCALCHLESQVKKHPVHRVLSQKVTQVACSECHGAHGIKKISEWKNRVSGSSYCLNCHKYQFSKTLKSGEQLDLSINEPSFNKAVHGTLTCTVCHRNFSKTKHPVAAFKKKQDYSVKFSESCAMCHPETELRKNPIHSSLTTKASCAECHGAHYIKGIAAQKTTTQESRYCLSCHKSRLSMTMRNGERLSVYVDETAVKNSVHGAIQCTDCHAEFSKTSHPVRSFESRAEYSLVSSGLCGKCHADANTKYEGSIHDSVLKSGNRKAPSCTGCHGSHEVARATGDERMGIMLCNKCHGDMNASYEESIHYKARMAGNKEAPLCSSCHNAHDVESTKMTTKIKDGCLKCHKDADKVHSTWLKNPPIALSSFARAHFDVVSCAACHSPNATRYIYLSLFDRKTGKPIYEEDLAVLLETDAAALKGKIDKNGDGKIEGSELWALFAELYKRDVFSTFVGKMDVNTTAEAHAIAAKSEGVKVCEQCHHPEAEYFDNIAVVVSKKDGKLIKMQASDDILNSIYSIIPVSTFYALGSSNIKLFDILFVVALIGGIAVPIGHITLRIITSPLRSLRRMGKGGKK